MDAEDVVELINFTYPGLTIDELIKLQKQCTVQEIDEDFELTENIMTLAKLTQELNLTEDVIMVVEDNDSYEYFNFVNFIAKLFHMLKDLNRANRRTINCKLTTY